MKFIRSPSTTRRNKRSMQYYRVWIYSCNGVLGITSVVFAIFAAFVLTDVRLSLLGGVELYHPTFLYAYLALILQCGVVQTIGCLGAQRLSHKLLSIYWILLLVLTIGDVVVGIVWIFKLDKVKLNLRPVLTREFISKYSTDESFTNTWNLVQSENFCCGVDGPLDYDKLSSHSSISSSSSKLNNSSSVVDVESSLLSLPESCCIVIYDSAPVNRGGGVIDGLNQTYRGSYHSNEKEFPSSSSSSSSLPHHHQNGGGGWDDRGGNDASNVTANEYALVGGDGLNKSYSSHRGHFLYDDDVEDDSNLLMNDSPLPIQQQEEDESEFGDDYEDNNVKEMSLVEGQSQSSSDTALSLEEKKRNANKKRKLEKHKTRHENHRWKVSPPQMSVNISSNLSKKDDKGESLLLLKSASLVSVENQNLTKLKPYKTQKSFLPKFSFPTKSPQEDHPNTPEPETTEKLPMPFTCQRHFLRRVRNHHHQHFDTPNKNSLPLGEASGGGGGMKLNTDVISESSSVMSGSINRVSSEVEINDNTDNFREHDKNVAERAGQPQWTRKSNQNQILRKKRHISISTLSSLGKNVDVSPSHTPTTLEPIPGSNVFSFLHASAFPYQENKKNNENSNDDENEGGDGSNNYHPGQAATEIQAAYYFSSSHYQSSALNASLTKRFQVYRHGCGVKLIQWVDHVSGILFILGFCIIGFVKISFLIILRTEIGEMMDKILILELDNPGSPSKTQLKDQRLHHVSHPLLTHPHRASTVSAHAYNATLPTIKSPPEGLCSGPNRFTKSYQMRRHSNIIGDRSSTHSQETVNMTVLVTNNSGGGGGNSGQCASGGCSNNPTESSSKQTGRSNPNLSNFLLCRDDFDPISISVPNTAKYLRRSSTCSVSAHLGGVGGYSYFYDGEPRPGPSSRFYQQDNPHHHNMYHPNCIHSHHARPRLYARNMSIGAVVHHGISEGSGGSRIGGGGYNPSASTAAAATSSFRTGFGAGSVGGSANCSFSSRDENEILSASMENVVEVETNQQRQPSSEDDEKEQERRDAEIRDWAAATACTEISSVGGGSSTTPTTTTTAPVTVSLGDYTKAGFNHSSDSAESNGGPGRRNGNNNVESSNMDSIPISYRGTAV